MRLGELTAYGYTLFSELNGPPALLDQAAATIQVMSGGRLRPNLPD